MSQADRIGKRAIQRLRMNARREMPTRDEAKLRQAARNCGLRTWYEVEIFNPYAVSLVRYVGTIQFLDVVYQIPGTRYAGVLDLEYYDRPYNKELGWNYGWAKEKLMQERGTPMMVLNRKLSTQEMQAAIVRHLADIKKNWTGRPRKVQAFDWVRENEMLVYNGLVSFWMEHYRSPSTRELADVVGLNQRTIRKYIRQLVRKQYIRIDDVEHGHWNPRPKGMEILVPYDNYP